MDPILERAVESGSAADLKAVSEWWAPGQHTRKVDPATARTLVERGATLSVHAAAGFGFTDHLAGMLRDDPTLIDAKGCDACTPLHFARDVATARMLLDHGARIDARDEDHNSTPAQWLIGEAPDVARFLLSRGASSDIFMAAAHGCLERIVGLHLAAGCGASLETIRLLLRSGAAAHAHTDNHFGYTPLRAATETGHEDVAALLRELDSPPGAA